MTNMTALYIIKNVSVLLKYKSKMPLLVDVLSLKLLNLKDNIHTTYYGIMEN